MQNLRVGVSGKAQVYCVHDREKRIVVTEAQVAELGFISGHIYNPKQHKIHRCSCCENLFVDPSDIPMYCPNCRKAPVHRIAGPLQPPKGVVN